MTEPFLKPSPPLTALGTQVLLPLLLLLVLIGHSHSHVGASLGGGNRRSSNAIDADRPAQFLWYAEPGASPKRPSGFIYREGMEEHETVITNVVYGPDGNVVPLPIKSSLYFENEIKVWDRPETKGQFIESNNTFAYMEITGEGLSPIHCELGSLERITLRTRQCSIGLPFLKLANDTGTFITDENGKVLQVTSSNMENEKFEQNQILQLEQEEEEERKRGEREGAVKKSSDLHAQIDHSTQLMSVVPKTFQVKPGDSWPVEEETMDGLETIEATGTLLGYIDSKGIDCAVISVSGSLRVQLDAIQKRDGFKKDNDSSHSTVQSLSNATFSRIMYWDYQNTVTHWSEANLTGVLHQTSADGGDGEDRHISETSIIYCDIVGRLPSTSTAIGNSSFSARAKRFCQWMVFGLGTVGLVVAAKDRKSAASVVRLVRELYDTKVRNGNTETIMQRGGKANGQELVPMAMSSPEAALL